MLDYCRLKFLKVLFFDSFFNVNTGQTFPLNDILFYFNSLLDRVHIGFDFQILVTFVIVIIISYDCKRISIAI